MEAHASHGERERLIFPKRACLAGSETHGRIKAHHGASPRQELASTSRLVTTMPTLCQVRISLNTWADGPELA